jgi:hypothetical protein
LNRPVQPRFIAPNSAERITTGSLPIAQDVPLRFGKKVKVRNFAKTAEKASAKPMVAISSQVMTLEDSSWAIAIRTTCDTGITATLLVVTLLLLS